MSHYDDSKPDFGTGKKELGIYVTGLIICSILTVIAFGAVMMNTFSKLTLFFIIFSTAIIQFLVQIIFFLRLNIQTPQGQKNVMSLLFTGVVLFSIIAGSLWIMWNLNYYMMH